MNEPRPINVLLLACFIVCVLCLCAHGASSQVSNLDTRTALAQSCWVEAGFSSADCNAIVHVLKRRARRANVELYDMVYAYTALKRDHARARFARTLPWGDEPSWNKATNALWRGVRRTVVAALNGAPSVCPDAMDWGGPALRSDMRRAMSAIEAGRWKAAECSAGTVNRFYSEVRR